MKVFYVYDTMCGWCMVASPEIAKLASALPPNISFDMLHINLFDQHYSPERTPAFLDKVRKVGFEIAPKMTGVKFSDAYLALLADPTFEHQSKNSALAIAAFGLLVPEKAIAYAKRLQDDLFLKGIDPSDLANAASAAESFGVLRSDFDKACNSAETQQMFNDVRELGRALMARSGAQGVPQLLAVDGHKVITLSPYDAAESLQTLASLSVGA